MPGKRADRALENALASLVRVLDQSGAGWAIIGGIAVIARGVRRFTTDIDAAVRGDEVEIERLIELFARKQIVGRIPDVGAFARANLVMLLRHSPTGVDLDVSFAWSDFERRAIASATEASFGKTRARMALPEHLVVFKAIAARPRDYEDADALLTLYPKLRASKLRREIAALAALAEAPEIVDGFDAMIARMKRGPRDR